MRLLSAVLFVALTGSVGFAEEPAPPPATHASRAKVPLRVVKLLPETRQVLLFDKNKGSHVVAEVGQDVDGYVVDEIGDDDVTLVAQNGTEVILTAPEPAWRRRASSRKASATGAPIKAELAPQDPYADPAPAADSTGGSIAGPVAAPITPGADGVRVADANHPTPTVAPVVEPGTGGVRVASAAAPAEYDPGVAAFMAAVAGEEIDEDGNPVAAPAPSPATTVPVTTATAVTAGPTTATIKRAEIDAALADFAQTSSTFRAAFVKDGLRFDDVMKGSLLARVGLERGDVVTTVDGQPLRSLDDAANLYARLPTARGTTLQVLRAGKPVTLRVSIQ